MPLAMVGNGLYLYKIILFLYGLWRQSGQESLGEKMKCSGNGKKGIPNLLQN